MAAKITSLRFTVVSYVVRRCLMDRLLALWQIARLPRRVTTRALVLWSIVALTVAGAGTERRVGRSRARHESKRQQRTDQQCNKSLPHESSFPPVHAQSYQ